SFRLMREPLSEYEKLDRYTALELGRKMGYSDAGLKTWNSATLGLSNQFVDELSGALFAGKHHLLVGTPEGLSYHLPSGSISEVLAEPLRFAVQSLGGSVTTNAKAESLEKGAVRTLVHYSTPEGRAALETDYVILALQPWQARPLVPFVDKPWTTL